MKECEGITSVLFSSLFFIKQHLHTHTHGWEMSHTGPVLKLNFIHAISLNLCEFVALLEEVKIQ